MYQDSEDLIGNWWVNMSMVARGYVSYIHRFKRTGKRNDIFLATKFGFTFNTPGRIINGSPVYVKESLEKSLKRLGVDFVDLFYFHRPDTTVPIEVRMLLELLNVHSVSFRFFTAHCWCYGRSGQASIRFKRTGLMF